MSLLYATWKIQKAKNSGGGGEKIHIFKQNYGIMI